MDKFDAIIIGGGPAGYHAAMELSKNGKAVVVVEASGLGGTCLHRGCIPTKSLLYCAKHIERNYDEKLINSKKKSDIQRLYKGLKYQIQQCGVKIIQGRGKLTSDREKNNLVCIEVDKEKYYADYVIITTGSDYKNLDIKGVQEAIALKRAVYSDAFLELEKYPDNITIIGAGVVGIEFASFLNMIGKKVCILESQKYILSGMLDDDVNALFIQELVRRGIEIITDIYIEEVDNSSVIYKKNNEYEEYTSDLIVIASGRKANIEDIGLESAEVAVDAGYIWVDEHCCTSDKKIYACGDVIGKSMLAHSAYREAEVAVDNICGKDQKMDYSAIPITVYSNPEIATAGKTENELRKDKIKYYVKKKSMLYSSRYSIEHSEFPGLCKLIFDDTGVLVGAQMVGNGSSEIVFTLADMILTSQTERDIRNEIFPHPSIIEIIKETACSEPC